MKGVLLHYNAESNQGLIRAEDGRRYAFNGPEWRSERRPTIGEEVDFEPRGTVAHEIYALKGAAPQVDLSRLRESVTQGARDLGGSDVGQRFLARWTAIIALVTLIGCMLPFISFGGQSASLFGVGSEIGRAVDGLTQLENVGRMFGGNSFNTRRPAVEPPSLSGARWTLRIGYLLYLIPILSFAVVAFELLSRPAGRLSMLQGIASIALPIAVPLLLAAAIYAQLPAELRQMTGQLRGIDISFLGLGFWVMVLSGIAQIANVLGFIGKQPRDLMGSR